MIKIILHKLLPTKRNPLGRWQVHDQKKYLKFVRASWANMDSCGGKLCSNPKKYVEEASSLKNKKQR